MMAKDLQPTQYIKQLDSLRAIAAILVILWHWVPTDHFLNTFDNGAIGVNTFFVLSGFLITRILFSSRDQAAALQQDKGSLFKRFYFRRAVRIFPIYYLTLLAIVVFHRYLGAHLGRAELINSAFYTVNFYFYSVKEWGDLTVHFWSLAVEEQFYLIWPFIIFSVPKKYFIPVIVLFISIGIVTQCFIQDYEYGYLVTPACLDAFGLGAWLAWVALYRPAALPKVYKVLGILSLLCMVILVLQVFTGWWPHVPQRTLHSVVATWLITYILLQGNKPHFPFSFVFNHPLLLFLGKISYGIYMYHVPLQWVGFAISRGVNKYLPYAWLRPYHAGIVTSINFCLLIFIAWLSWICIEKPLLRLKTYYDAKTIKAKEAAALTLKTT